MNSFSQLFQKISFDGERFCFYITDNAFPHLVNENIENLLFIQVYLPIVEMWIIGVFLVEIGAVWKLVQGKNCKIKPIRLNL